MGEKVIVEEKPVQIFKMVLFIYLLVFNNGINNLENTRA